MNQSHVKYLLAGGGLASSSAAQAIRELDKEGAILLVGQEINRPYHRPPLSKEFIRGQMPRTQLFTLEAGWFADHQVELRTGRRVAGVDTVRHTATLDNGEEISFDRMLIAAGGSAKPLTIPGAKLPNVYSLRTLEDAERLSHAMEKAKAEGRRHDRGRGRVTIIGGGVLGVELVASLTSMGLHADLIVPHAYPWDKFAGENTGRFLTRYLEQRGVTVFSDRRTDRLEGDGRVQRVVLATGEILETDLVIGAIGMLANKDLIRGTPIVAERAILTDAHCRTSAPDVYAAGDCAAVFDPLFNRHRLLDHWDNAIVTGRLAGRNMAGEDAPYDAVNYFFSDVFELSLSAWGESRHVARRLLRGNPNGGTPDFVEIGIDSDGRISQVLAIGHVGEDDALRELVHRRLKVDGHEEALKDPRTPLAKVLG